MTQAVEGQFNPSFHFAGLIQKAIADGAARRCFLPGSPEVYIVPAENIYYTASPGIEALDPLCAAAPFDLTVEVLPDWRRGDGNEMVQVGRAWIRKQTPGAPSHLSPRPLSELLWYATLCASRGQLLQGCHADDPVRLKRWPDFSTLHHRESYLVLAAFMAGETADLVEVAENTGVPLPQVFDFHNACAVLGLIERGNVFEPREYLLGLIQRSIADRQMRRCVLPGHAPLFIAPDEGKYHTAADGASLAALCSAMLIDLEVEAVSGLGTEGEEEEVVQIGRMWVRRRKEAAAPRIPARPLSELLFMAALGASRGRILAGSRAADPVRLNRWPDAFCLEQDRRFFPLAAFMTANAAALPTIAKQTGIPLAGVIDFHNACAATGLIEHSERENITARQLADGEREIYRKISRALDGRKAGLRVE
jgi:hypothetical protein